MWSRSDQVDWQNEPESDQVDKSEETNGGTLLRLSHIGIQGVDDDEEMDNRSEIPDLEERA